MVRPLAVVVMLGGCVTMPPSAVSDANDIVVRAPQRARRSAPPLRAPGLEHPPPPAPASAVALDAASEVVASEVADSDDAPLRPWRELVAALERSEPESDDRSSAESELARLMDEMPATARDFLEANCRATRWLESEELLTRGLAEARRRAGADIRKLYGSLRNPSKANCARADVAFYRLELARLAAPLDQAARVAVAHSEELHRLGVATQTHLITDRAERELSGLRTEVAAAAPGSLELANLDEIIRERCEAAGDETKVCSVPSIESLAHLVKVRAKALGAKHAEVAAARLRYARALLASSDAKHRALGEQQLRTILSHAVSGSTTRLLATTELVVALRVRQDTARALVLERAFVTELASPTSDRDVTLLGEAAATIATIAMAEHRDDDAHAVLVALMKAYAGSPLDVCGAERCDVREAQVEMLEKQASIQPVRAYEIEQRIAEIQASIEASERVGSER